VALKLTRARPFRIGESTELLSELSELSSSGHWVFLTSHGMWAHDIRSGLWAVIDAEGGGATIFVNYRYYRLVRALQEIPLFHLGVRRVSALKEDSGRMSPWGVHVRVKRGELLPRPEDGSEVSPLAFHAVTSGLHRLGHSYRIQAVQSSLSREIARALVGHEPCARCFHEAYGIEEEEVAGALAALASGIVGWNELDKRSIKEELTTAVIGYRLEEVHSSRIILKHLANAECPEVRVAVSNGTLQLESDGEFGEAVRRLSNRVVGRLRAYIRFLKRLRDVHGEFDLVVDFSEQMGPCDFYLLYAILDRWGSAGCTWVLATPLSYPIATLSSLYATSALADWLGEVKVIITSEDPEVAAAAAERVASHTDGRRRILYLAAGPTPHVLVFGRRLRRELGDRAVLMPLVPPLR